MPAPEAGRDSVTSRLERALPSIVTVMASESLAYIAATSLKGRGAISGWPAAPRQKLPHSLAWVLERHVHIAGISHGSNASRLRLRLRLDLLSKTADADVD